MKIKNKADKLLTCELFLIVVLSLILTIYIMFYTNNCHINTFFSFYVSIFSLLLVCVSVFNWVFFPLKKIKEGISFKSKLTQYFDRMVSQGHSSQLLWLGTSFVILYVVMAGWMGTFNALDMLPATVGGLNPVSLTFMLFTDSGTLGNALRSDSHVSVGVILFCLVISILGALIFTGLLISVFSNYFQRRVEDYLQGRVRYQLANHIIFIGYDEILPSIVNQVLSKYAEPPISVILTNTDTDKVRKELEPQLASQEYYKRLIFYKGSRWLRHVIEKLYVNFAKEIYIIGNQREDNHDEKNIQCINHVIDIINKSTTDCKYLQRIPVYILMEGHTRFKDSILWWQKELNVDIRPFNTYVDWAKILLNGNVKVSDYGKFKYPKIVSRFDGRIVNIVIFGNKRFGHALGIEALSLLPDLFEPGASDVVSLITFICDDAKRELDTFKVYYSNLFQQVEYKLLDFSESEKTLYCHERKDIDLNISFEFITSSPINPILYSFLSQRESQGKYNMSIFACTENDTVDSNIGIFLPLKSSNVYILQRYGTSYIEKIRKNEMHNKQIFPFGMIDDGYDWNNARVLDDVSVAGLMLKNGENNFNKGEYKKALINYIQSLNIRKLIVGENHLETAWNYYDIGVLYYKLREFSNSLTNYYNALNIRKAICGDDHPEVSNCHNQIGKLYREIAIQNNNDSEKEKYFKLALEHLNIALKIRIKCYGENNDDVAASYNNIGNLYRETCKYEKAYSFLEKGLTIRESLFKQDRIKETKLMDTKHNMGRLYTCTEQYDKAEHLLKEAYNVYKEQLREHDSYIGMASSSLGDLYYKKGDYLTAKKYYEEACQVYITEYHVNNPDHDYIKETKEKLRNVEEKLVEFSSG